MCFKVASPGRGAGEPAPFPGWPKVEEEEEEEAGSVWGGSAGLYGYSPDWEMSAMVSALTHVVSGGRSDMAGDPSSSPGTRWKEEEGVMQSALSCGKELGESSSSVPAGNSHININLLYFYDHLPLF